MKKIFAQPEMMVVKVVKNDIITDSLPMDPNSANALGAGEILGAGRRNVFDEWYEGY